MTTKLKRIFRKLTRRNRLNEYETILTSAIERGYRVMCLKEWMAAGCPGDKVFLSRHDVDIDVRGARRMYEIEKRLHVRATYYFRHLTMDRKLMKQMSRDGFEVGLHYETLATIIRERHVTTKEQLTADILNTCRTQLAKEIQDFRKEIGNIVSICSHGSRWNRVVGIANHVLVDEKFKSQNQISFEAYDPDVRDRISTYISDSSINHEHAWKYGKSPAQALEDEDPVILLLTHPEHWNYDYYSNARKLWTEFIDRN